MALSRLCRALEHRTEQHGEVELQVADEGEDIPARLENSCTAPDEPGGREDASSDDPTGE